MFSCRVSRRRRHAGDTYIHTIYRRSIVSYALLFTAHTHTLCTVVANNGTPRVNDVCSFNVFSPRVIIHTRSHTLAHADVSRIYAIDLYCTYTYYNRPWTRYTPSYPYRAYAQRTIDAIVHARLANNINRICMGARKSKHAHDVSQRLREIRSMTRARACPSPSPAAAHRLPPAPPASVDYVITILLL